MNSDEVLKLSHFFCSLATSEKMPANSKELKTILSNLDELKTYQSRKKYAERNLKHLSSGSSRIVYLTSNKTVIKLAKNDKGIAQNKAETNPKMKSKFINKVLGHSKHYVWVEVDYLDKITEKDFKKMTGIEFEDFDKAIRYGLKSVSGNTDKDKPNNFKEVEKSKIYKEMKELGSKFRLMPGDLAKISSWGTKNDAPVLIDAGLTKGVFEEFYES